MAPGYYVREGKTVTFLYVNGRKEKEKETRLPLALPGGEEYSFQISDTRYIKETSALLTPCVAVSVSYNFLSIFFFKESTVKFNFPYILN